MGAAHTPARGFVGAAHNVTAPPAQHRRRQARGIPAPGSWLLSFVLFLLPCFPEDPRSVGEGETKRYVRGGIKPYQRGNLDPETGNSAGDYVSACDDLLVSLGWVS